MPIWTIVLMDGSVDVLGRWIAVRVESVEVLIDIWMDGCMDGWMYGYIYGWMDIWIYGYMDIWMDGWMDGWMNG